MAFSGPIGASMEALANSLANCYYFQRWQGATWDVAEARTHIYKYGIPDPPNNRDHHTLQELNALRPFVEIFHGTEEGITLTWDAAPNNYRDSGTLICRFEQCVDSSACSKAEAEAAFDEFIDTVLVTNNDAEPGLVELAGQVGFFIWDTLTIQPSTRTAPEEQTSYGDAQAKYLIFEYGGLEA